MRAFNTAGLSRSFNTAGVSRPFNRCAAVQSQVIVR